MTTRQISQSRFRPTRNSIVIDPKYFVPPYDVTHAFHEGPSDRLVHACAWLRGAEAYLTCCRVRFGPASVVREGPTCLQCARCTGCAACVPGWIREETMALGMWETKDSRTLYPFEMDGTHLVNSIAKLTRHKGLHKKNWRDWLMVLGAEAKQRGLL